MDNTDAIFTTQHYIATLKKYKETHKFSFFDNCSSNDIILRHDIDFSLDDALRIAQIENELEIKSTYFILLHSELYNPFGFISSKNIINILKLGHQIALHYDETFFHQTGVNISDGIRKEIGILEQHFDTKINVVVRHNPSISGKKIPVDLPSGVVDAMSNDFTLNRKYISDSVRYWRETKGHLFCSDENIYSEMQILIHPALWTDKVLSRHDTLSRIMNNLQSANENQHRNISDIWTNYIHERIKEQH